MIGVIHRIIQKTKFSSFFVPFLFLQLTKINGPSIQSCRCPGFHPSHVESVLFKLFTYPQRSCFSYPSPLHFYFSNMHQPINKCPGSKNNCLCPKCYSHGSYHALNSVSFNEQLYYGVLPEMQIRICLKHFSPLQGKHTSVALCPRTPHSRTF